MKKEQNFLKKGQSTFLKTFQAVFRPNLPRPFFKKIEVKEPLKKLCPLTPRDI